MKYSILPALMVLLFFGSCHPNNGNNINPTYSIWGDMTVRKTTSDSITLSGYGNSTTANAAFYRTPNNSNTRIAVNSIFSNGTQLRDKGDSWYTEELRNGIDTHVLWEVNGNSQVAGFSYDHAGSFPDYTGPKIPDTIIRANGFTMSFPAGTITGGDSVAINFFLVSHAAPTLFQYKGMDQNHNVVFSPQELSVLEPGRNFANIIIKKSTYQTFAGKQYHFGKERVYMSIVVLR